MRAVDKPCKFQPRHAQGYLLRCNVRFKKNRPTDCDALEVLFRRSVMDLTVPVYEFVGFGQDFSSVNCITPSAISFAKTRKVQRARSTG